MARTVLARDVGIAQTRSARIGNFMAFRVLSYVSGEVNPGTNDRDSALFASCCNGHLSIAKYILERTNVCNDQSFGLIDVTNIETRKLLIFEAERNGCKLKEYTWDDLK